MIDSFRKKYSFLSNFSPAPIFYENMLYDTVEHAYQAAKSLDYLDRFTIKVMPTPRAAKRAGRLLVLRPDWEQVKLSIMEELLRKKFEDYRLLSQLKSTGYEELVEGNYCHDNFYGNCLCHKCKNIVGMNHLGKLLMKIRRRPPCALHGCV